MKNNFNILTIEDNPPDAHLLLKALQKIENVDIKVENVATGQAAIDFVKKKGDYKYAFTPDLVILDLNLPVVSGYEVLKIIKEDEILQVIPVIIYTTSEEEADIWTSYHLNANSYITKTFDIKDIFEKIAILGEYWLKASRLPEAQRGQFYLEKEKE